MASKRPYFSSSCPQLQSLFESNRNDTKVLRDLLAELKHRSTPTANALKREVEEALFRLRSQGKHAGHVCQGTLNSQEALLPGPKSGQFLVDALELTLHGGQLVGQPLHLGGRPRPS